MSEQSTAQLLSIFIWGNEPDNIPEIREILESRGLDIDAITKEIDGIIKKYSEK